MKLSFAHQGKAKADSRPRACGAAKLLFTFFFKEENNCTAHMVPTHLEPTEDLEEEEPQSSEQWRDPLPP